MCAGVVPRLVAQIDRGAHDTCTHTLWGGCPAGGAFVPRPRRPRAATRVMCSQALPLSAVCCARPRPWFALRRATRYPDRNDRSVCTRELRGALHIVLPTHSPLSSLSPPQLDFPAWHLHTDLALPRPNLPPLSSCADARIGAIACCARRAAGKSASQGNQ